MTMLMITKPLKFLLEGIFFIFLPCAAERN